jgi:hypothetical protein
VSDREAFDRIVLLDGAQALLVATLLDGVAVLLRDGRRLVPQVELNDPALVMELSGAIRRQLEA